MAGHQRFRGPHPACSPDMGIADFYLFGPSKQQLSGRTMHSEKNVLETVSEILSELPKDEVKNAFEHWKRKMPVDCRPQSRVLSELAKRQATSISFRLICDLNTEDFLSTLSQKISQLHY
jgi:hypothetical protein